MKKILSITCLAILMFSSKIYSQSNVTWKVIDNVQKGYFKSTTVFNCSFYGFANKTEANSLISKLKSNPEVQSLEVSNGDVNGNSNVKLVMKTAHDKMYYVGLGQKLGVTYFEVNGKKQTPEQITAEKRNKK